MLGTMDMSWSRLKILEHGRMDSGAILVKSLHFESGRLGRMPE